MSNLLRAPDLGPIVGHTTAESLRVWMRASHDGDHRSVGVAGLVRPGKKTVEAKTVQYFRLHRKYDRTGCADFNRLEPDTAYSVRVASLAVDTVDPDLIESDEEVFSRLPTPTKWASDLNALDESAVAQARTFPRNGQLLSFIFGSCRYPGILWGKKRADRVFCGVKRRFDQPLNDTAPRFLLMVGDQIYADMFNRRIPIGYADTAEEFRERYETAFGSHYMRQLLRAVPTYMILDDHEIEDNWVQGRIRDATKRMLFNVAILAYRSYQWFHSPRTYGDSLYYEFECAGSPFFVLDMRTQRLRDDDDEELNDNHLLGMPRNPEVHDPVYKGQLDLVCEWLVRKQQEIGDRPKFIVSSGVFVPNDVVAVSAGEQWKSDSWPAFPNTRKQLLRTIVDHKIQNVVFLSGDVHCSNIAQIEFENSQGLLPLKAFSITSSAFYWPFPFADGDPLTFVHDSRLQNDPFRFEVEGGSVTMHYRAANFVQDDNFTQVDYDPGRQQITVTNFDKDGNPLPLRNNVLHLA